ncbi:MULTISPECIES: hypothetical protein [Phaeobacter]|uniref:hypothetical protein n=1 Tax=Phaeobacter TaxID=302485 RepID=UPI0003D6D2B9|nr:hypothetical protein [Phaeobacter gallaeciensis]AHD12158.1 hypothetical protein Gal_04454 [Phaeobacter gallaeciensis DSM 26640]ATE95342.1 hypothetical protein PhaeoP11_04358 [Phaeobacter gallaeciensis]
MPHDPKVEFCLHAYVVANRARCGQAMQGDMWRLATLALELDAGDRISGIMKAATITFLKTVRVNRKKAGEDLAEAVQTYADQLGGELPTYDWQNRADLQ